MGVENVKSTGKKIILDKERTVKFTLGAFRYLSQKYGSVGKALAGLSSVEGLTIMDEKTLDLILDLTLAGLRHEDKSLTIDELADILTTDNLGPVIVAIGEALGLSLPESKDEDKQGTFPLEP